MNNCLRLQSPRGRRSSSISPPEPSLSELASLQHPHPRHPERLAPASSLLLRGPTSRAREHRLRLLALPMRTRAYSCQWPDAGSPSFRRSPSARDVFFDPGRATVPRIAAPLMLRSTIPTASAPAMCQFRGSVAHPTQSLCTLRGRRCRRLTQHSLPSGPLRPYSDRSRIGWTAPAILATRKTAHNCRDAGSYGCTAASTRLKMSASFAAIPASLYAPAVITTSRLSAGTRNKR